MDGIFKNRRISPFPLKDSTSSVLEATPSLLHFEIDGSSKKRYISPLPLKSCTSSVLEATPSLLSSNSHQCCKFAFLAMDGSSKIRYISPLPPKNFTSTVLDATPSLLRLTFKPCSSTPSYAAPHQEENWVWKFIEKWKKRFSGKSFTKGGYKRSVYYLVTGLTIGGGLQAVVSWGVGTDNAATMKKIQTMRKAIADDIETMEQNVLKKIQEFKESLDGDIKEQKATLKNIESRFRELGQQTDVANESNARQPSQSSALSSKTDTKESEEKPTS